ncbi:hypothetical protein LZC95_45810 [Pendulispora brunnea]|uniref:Uncharacterized protein n=1 Tax=Pendulispora brunnea TaxID=2905690 RepID=A0ABZ2K8R7_9BACT
MYVDTQYQNESSKGLWDLVVGQRTSSTSVGKATWLEGINSPQTDRWPFISADSLTLVFASDRGRPGKSRIFLSRRSTTSVPFGPAQEISGLPPGSLQSPYLRGNELWFQGPDGNGDIYWSTLTNGMAGPATPVSELNYAATPEISPVVTPEGLLAFWASANHETDGGPPSGRSDFDIWLGTRGSLDESFYVRKVTELNSESNEWPTWISPDGCRLYFISKREGAQFVYVASR